MVKKGEVIDKLRDDLYIIQKKAGFKYGIDSVLLAHFIRVSKEDVLLDFGTGSGIIPLLLYAKGGGARSYGIDIQREYIEMANRTLRMNHIRNIRFIEGDFCRIGEYIKRGSISVAVSNPPYFKSELQSPNPEKRIARHEVSMTLFLLLKSVKEVLCDQGRFFLIYPAQRMAELFFEMKRQNIEPKEVRPIYSKVGKKAELILVKGVRNGRPGIQMLSPLTIYEGTDYHPEIYKIYSEVTMKRG